MLALCPFALAEPCDRKRGCTATGQSTTTFSLNHLLTEHSSLNAHSALCCSMAHRDAVSPGVPSGVPPLPLLAQVVVYGRSSRCARLSPCLEHWPLTDFTCTCAGDRTEARERAQERPPRDDRRCEHPLRDGGAILDERSCTDRQRTDRQRVRVIIGNLSYCRASRRINIYLFVYLFSLCTDNRVLGWQARD